MFRPDKSYSVTRGKWYFEFEIVTAGNMRVGWARPGCTPDKELGSDDQAFVFDGFEVRYSNLRVLNMTTINVNKPQYGFFPSCHNKTWPYVPAVLNFLSQYTEL